MAKSFIAKYTSIPDRNEGKHAKILLKSSRLIKRHLYTYAQTHVHNIYYRGIIISEQKLKKIKSISKKSFGGAQGL